MSIEGPHKVSVFKSLFNSVFKSVFKSVFNSVFPPWMLKNLDLDQHISCRIVLVVVTCSYCFANQFYFTPLFYISHLAPVTSVNTHIDSAEHSSEVMLCRLNVWGLCANFCPFPENNFPNILELILVKIYVKGITLKAHPSMNPVCWFCFESMAASEYSAVATNISCQIVPR